MQNLKSFTKYLSSLVMLSLQLITYADVNGVEVIGSETVILSERTAEPKEIKLNKVKLSDNFKQEMKSIVRTLKFQPEQQSFFNINDFDTDVGMNNVPVLDQGRNNTCALFAISAWLNANKNAGDYVSQQCLLELGVYLNQYNGEDSGWDNIRSGTVFLDRINNYGAVNKSTCPRQYPEKSQIMDPQTYWNYSEGRWSQNLNWSYVQPKDLNVVRQALNKGQRVYIEVLLHKNYVPGFPINGNSEGLWALPKDPYERQGFINDILSNNNIVGHALVVTAYSDSKNLFKVRNSWGTKYGDKGEFYMSYDFYKLMDYNAIVMY